MKSIVVATIGTRDLMFQIASGKWFNIGDDRMQDGDIIGEQAEVLSDLGLSSMGYRELTQYLLESSSSYLERIKPVIIGKLLRDRASEIERIYLIGTDQAEEVQQRNKDTIYGCKLIQNWVENVLNPETKNEIITEVISLGSQGTNPSNFEEMFQWWQKVWRDRLLVQEEQPIWLCLKGGVGQSAEAGRISGLSRYGDRIQFFEFQPTPRKNQVGTPSDYSGPFLGTNYLWDRTQQQALKLLTRYDYAGVLELLEPYFKQNPSGFKAVPTYLNAGVAWNQGEFQTFFNLAKSTLSTPQRRKQAQEWWWMGYEQAYMAIVRLKQQNTTEAMLHSYRAIEATIMQWVAQEFSAVRVIPHEFPTLNRSILNRYPKLETFFDADRVRGETIKLTQWVLEALLNEAIPEIADSQDFKSFWSSANTMRNILSHQLGGLSQTSLFDAWEVANIEQLESRLVRCLNVLSGQSCSSLTQISLFAETHHLTKKTIENFQF